MFRSSFAGAVEGGGGSVLYLEQFCRDLTKMACEGDLDPVIGREKEVERMMQILSRRTKNNPVLVGDPGVGKTAVVEGLALRIANRQGVPGYLLNKRLLSLDLASVVAETKFRGEFESRLKKIIEEIKDRDNIILFIDEFHTLVGAGAAIGGIDAGNILKPFLARGELQCIGATTLGEYRKYVERDAALERRFQPIMVSEPCVDDAIRILGGLRSCYEEYHDVRMTDEAVEAAVRLSDRYISDRFLPDKAIDLLDEAAARVRLTFSHQPPQDIQEMEERLARIRTRTSRLFGEIDDLEGLIGQYDQEFELEEEIEARYAEWRAEMGEKLVTVDDVCEVVTSWTGIPVRQLQEDENQKLVNLEQLLSQRVIGQEDAVAAVAQAIKRSRVGLKNPERPIGSFMFLGPTGVGKTELAKALAETLFGNQGNMIRIDMSEYMERFAVSRLIGSPPGYVGFDEGGQLTNAVRRRPFSVVLFDEIEKGHPDVFNILLQILDDGILTDAKGRKVDFSNTVVIMTSNASVRMPQEKSRIGFIDGGEAECELDEAKQKMTRELSRVFRPEFLNRIDEIVVFNSLGPKEIREIVLLMLDETIEQMSQMGIQMTVSERTVKMLCQNGFDQQYGARPLRRTIQRMVSNPLSEELLTGRIKPGCSLLVDCENEKVSFQMQDSVSLSA